MTDGNFHEVVLKLKFGDTRYRVTWLRDMNDLETLKLSKSDLINFCAHVEHNDLDVREDDRKNSSCLKVGIRTGDLMETLKRKYTYAISPQLFTRKLTQLKNIFKLYFQPQSTKDSKLNIILSLRTRKNDGTIEEKNDVILIFYQPENELHKKQFFNEVVEKVKLVIKE